MVCVCCRLSGDDYAGVGNCSRCNNEACDFLANGHGEDCTHCDIFYCYRHQDEHCRNYSLEPFKVFPKTYIKSTGIITLIFSPVAPDKQMIQRGLNHGIYFAKKLRNPQMERKFRKALALQIPDERDYEEHHEYARFIDEELREIFFQALDNIKRFENGDTGATSMKS
jgi:hypothetical protein